jgi:murein DD-endopeptidase MepM/ murein hydrolase activator NlpD
MANKMVANIKSLTTGVDELTRKVNALYESLEKVSSVSTSAMEGATGVLKNNGGSAHLGTAITRPGTGADGATFAPQTYSGPGTNQVNASLGQFSSQGGGGQGGGFPLDPGSGAGHSRFVQGAIGLAKINLAGFAGMYAGMPDLALTMQRSVGYYQAGLKSPGINRAQLERATFGAMDNGLSSRGSDAAVAALLAGRGYMPGSSNYLQAAAQVGGAFKYLGLDNAAAADAIAGFQSGPMAANLYQYGITTTDSKGKEKTPGQLVKELIPVLTGGRGYSSAEAVAFSRQKGNLGVFLRENFDAAQQEIVYQGIIDYTEGRNPDLAVRGNEQGGGNANTALTAAGRLSGSETELMMKAESAMIRGFENAADTVEAFNKLLGISVEQMGYLKGLVGGVGGTNVGAALSTGITMLISGMKDLASAITKIPILGGATSGFGAGFNTGIGPRGGAAANGFGAKDNSGIWASTNNVHTGQDFPMKIGSPVSASLDGYVSSINPGPGYGTAIVIDHPNGYQTVYGHLSERTVNLGEQVKKGQKIGKSGNTGNTTGPHLHYEVRQGKNNPVNPDVLKYFGAESPVGSANSVPMSTSSTSSSASNTAGTKAILGTGDQQEWAAQFLTRIGAPVTETNLKSVNTWMRYEGGHWKNSAHYNPLNTTLDMGGSEVMNSHNVRRYTSMEEGLDATVRTILGNKSAERGYDAIVGALKNNADPQTVFNLINDSSWGTKIRGGATSGYGASIPQNPVVSGNKTVNITVKFDEANELTAMRFAKQVQKFLNHNNETSMIGNS